jgi:hypothetical protein
MLSHRKGKLSMGPGFRRESFPAMPGMTAQTARIEAVSVGSA